jgi:hypothetical protein
MMRLYRDDTHTFIIRIWREPREPAGRPFRWRGVIEHMASGQSHYLTHLSEIPEFIVPYLAMLGMRIPLFWRFKRWIKQIRVDTADR